MADLTEVRPFPLGTTIATLPGGAGFDERSDRAISIFNSVNKVIAQLPPETKFAIVAHAKVAGGEHEATLSAFLNLGHGLSFAGHLSHTKKGFAGEAALVLSR